MKELLKTQTPAHSVEYLQSHVFREAETVDNIFKNTFSFFFS